MRATEWRNVAAALVMLALTDSVVAQADRAPSIPAQLRPPAEQVLILTAQAKGVQIYICSMDDADSTRFKWTFVAPEAELFDEAGKKIGTHYAGPTWEALDGSKVVGVLA